MPATRKLYDALAATLDAASADDFAAVAPIVARIASVLAENNPRFEPARFMTAAGIKPDDYEVVGGFFGPKRVLAR